MFDDERQKLLLKRSRRIIEGVSREINKRKKIKVFLLICLFLWGAAGAQMIAERVFVRPARLTEAFINSNTIMNESMIELTSFYGSSYMTESDKEDLVRYIAEGLGIKIEKDSISSIKEEDKEAAVCIKKAARAETVIKCVTLDGAYSRSGMKEHYLFVRIIIHEDENNDILEYQKKVKALYQELSAGIVSDTIQFCGRFAGKLSISELDSLSDKMIGDLGGSIVYENRKEELYSVYAYTRGIDDYVAVDGLKMNIQVAASYDEVLDQTKIYLAAPIISGGW